MDRKEIEKHLFNALQPNDAIRAEAEIKIINLQSENYPYFLVNIVSIFTDPNSAIQLQVISGIILKNSLHSSDTKIQSTYEQKWCAIDVNTREMLKKQIMNNFCSPNEKIYNLAGSAIGFIARIELVNNLDSSFFKLMEQCVFDETRACAALEAISCGCVALSDETDFNFGSFVGIIFNICMLKIETPQSTTVVREAGLKCLMNCFNTISPIFGSKDIKSRFLIGIAVTVNADSTLASKALICLNRFVYLNYRFIGAQLQDIINYFNNFWNYPDEDIIVQVIEFWTVLADIKEDKHVVDNLNYLLPHVLRAMTKSENYVDLSWSAHKAAANFLETVAEKRVRTLFLHEIVYNYIDCELRSQNKVRIDVGAITLGSVITEGCEHSIDNSIKILIAYMRDPITEESCLWALSKICETNFDAVVNHLELLLKQACEIITIKQNSATTAAWIINSIFSSLNKIRSGKSFNIMVYNKYGMDSIKQHFEEMLRILVTASENVHLENSILRVALFAAMSEMIRYIDDEHFRLLDHILEYCKNKISECVAAINKATPNYIPIIEDVLSNYIILSEVIVTKRKRDSALIMLPIYMLVLKSKPSSAIGEVYIAVTCNIDEFAGNIEEFVPFMVRDLGCVDSFILKSAINLIGCMANLKKEVFFHLSTQFVPLLVQSLSSKHIFKEVKTQILSVFGDIAMSLEINFEQYLDMSSVIFMQILNLDRASDPDYVDDLRYNAIQMFNCIVLATCQSHKLREVMYRLVEGLKLIATDNNSDDTVIALVNLIRDLRALFGTQYDLNGVWVNNLYGRYAYCDTAKVREAVQDALN